MIVGTMIVSMMATASNSTVFSALATGPWGVSTAVLQPPSPTGKDGQQT